jgi:alpha-beta hydrolase superfamily lysophospholipase
MNWKRTLFGTWSWKRPFYSLAGIYLLLLTFILLGADSLIFQPPHPSFGQVDRHFLKIPAPAGDTISIHYREPDGGMPLLLWSHGNAEDLHTVHQFMNDLNEMGFGTLAYDYPGYGLSSGRPSEDGAYSALDAAYTHLLSLGHDPKRIIIVGQSVGSGPSCWLAEKKEAAGLILIAPFVSTFRSVTRIPIFPHDRFKNIDRIGKIRIPLLIIHGTHDHVLGYWNSKELFQEAASPDKELMPLPNAGHNNLWGMYGAEILLKMEDFAASVYPP